MTQIKAKWMGVAVALVVALAGESGAVSPAAALGDCEVTGCGSNTPVLFGTPIIGLSLVEGVVNDVDVMLEPELVRVRPLVEKHRRDCGSGAHLGIENGLFVGKIKGRTVCSGRELIGMAFWIAVPERPTGKRNEPSSIAKRQVQILIDDMGVVQTWHIDTPRKVPTYRLVWNQVPDPGNAVPGVAVGDSICPLREAWMEDWQQLVERKPRQENGHKRRLQPAWNSRQRMREQRMRDQKEETDHLLILQGETYTPAASIDTDRDDASWFNLACVGTALAKMRLLGYDPMAGSGLPDARRARLSGERQATLKMLTARYRGEQSYTVAGMPLMWHHRNLNQIFDGQPSLWRSDVVESYWGADGAICLNHRRTWRQWGSMSNSSPVPETYETMPSNLSSSSYASGEKEVILSMNLPPCRKPPKSYVWITYPVDHVVHSP